MYFCNCLFRKIKMDTHNDIVIIGSIVGIISAVYKLAIEPNINAKIADLETKVNARIANLETKGFLLIDGFKTNINDKFITLERKVDIHLENYANYKDANLLEKNGLNEKINHTWNKTKELFNNERAEREKI